MPCTEIDKDWAAQRIRGLTSWRHRRRRRDAARTGQPAPVKTLITDFTYPRLGPGQLWEAVRDDVVASGGTVAQADAAVVRVRPRDGAGHRRRDRPTAPRPPCDHLYSTMPLRDLVAGVRAGRRRRGAWAARRGLRFRDFLTVAVVVDRPERLPRQLDLRARPGRAASAASRTTRTGAPAMVADPAQTCLGLEYFCNAGRPAVAAGPTPSWSGWPARSSGRLGLAAGRRAASTGWWCGCPTPTRSTTPTTAQHRDTIRSLAGGRRCPTCTRSVAAGSTTTTARTTP